MQNRKYFSEWSAPYIKLCKDRDVKLSNKNLQKLRDAWIGFCLREYATDDVSKLNILFWCTYAEAIDNLIPSSCGLLSLIPKNDNWEGRLYHTPTVLGIEHGVVWNTEDE